MSSGLAVLRLKSLGLDVKVRHAQETSARGRLGSISEQSPAPGTKVPRGSVITVIIP
jgi:beta-lactam-binding protein with PASTA domain